MHHSVRYAIEVFGFFVVGTSLNAMKHAAGAVHSSLNGIKTYGQYWDVNGADQAFKSFGALCVLLWWSFNQTAMENFVALVWPWGKVPTWFQAVLVVTPATAGMFGMFWDVLLDFVMVYLQKRYPQLKHEVPPAAGVFEKVP